MYKEMMNLDGKLAVITGGDGLLGKEFCRGLAEFGAHIIIASNDEDKGRSVAMELNNDLGEEKVKYLYLDITSETSTEKFIEKTLDCFGKIDILVNSAYPRNRKYGAKFEDVEFESCKENVISHMGGYFQVAQKVAEVMKKQNSGVIINMGSIYGVLGPDFSVYGDTSMTMPVEYSMIKGGIINFTRYLATYLAPYNIRVNTVSPGGIFDNQPEEFVDNYCKRTPLDRMALPEDIVGSLIFLVSDASKYITGQNLLVDGGLSIW
ncbi:oxidoreductase [Methanobacterium aggregans]|uniref:oxidoreductase n=1 Tax=Methanobacterium aggregans TaxID=1615586 RepID=UPI001AE2A9F5|nr:oxidoreductase [Methanobacterium aggregans]MBP2044979.1 NAD(P)-dependent dehydrogenase (short-subunit alcohol dehydrogenase family) [Methanobacterium aggregans]